MEKKMYYFIVADDYGHILTLEGPGTKEQTLEAARKYAIFAEHYVNLETLEEEGRFCVNEENFATQTYSIKKAEPFDDEN